MAEGLDIAGSRSPLLGARTRGRRRSGRVPGRPGGSQTPDSVARAVADYLVSANANVGGPFVTSAATDQLLIDAHLAAADFLGCTEEEVVFGANTTTINFLLAHALARTLNPGDEIIVTEIDHDANVSPWLLIAGDRDLTVHTAPLDPEDGTLDLDAVEGLITARTRVVAFTLASNALGSIPDAARLANAAHSAGALVWVDGVHLAPTGGSIAPLSPPTCCSHRPTSTSDRTSGWPLSAPTWRAHCRPTGYVPRSRCRQAIASRPAPCATRRLPGSSPRSSTSSHWGRGRRSVRPARPRVLADRGVRTRSDPSDVGATG